MAAALPKRHLVAVTQKASESIKTFYKNTSWYSILFGCTVDFCASSRSQKLNLASVVEMEGEESGGAPANKKIKK